MFLVKGYKGLSFSIPQFAGLPEKDILAAAKEPQHIWVAKEICSPDNRIREDSNMERIYFIKSYFCKKQAKRLVFSNYGSLLSEP